MALPTANGPPRDAPRGRLPCLARSAFAKKVRVQGVRVGGLEHAEPDLSEPSPTARLLVTARGFSAARKAMRALRKTAPQALIQGTGFGAILLVEAATQDALALAERVSAGAWPCIGRVLVVFAEVATERSAIEEAVLAVARRYLAADDSFCFRLHKRGRHGLSAPSHELEREIGGAIWKALRARDGRDPRVDLERPDATISAQLLGPRTLVCLERRAWLREDLSWRAG